MDLLKALKKKPRDGRWLLRHGLRSTDLPDEAIPALRWRNGWYIVWYIPPQRVSKRWARMLNELHELEDKSEQEKEKA